jgi:hypothetical protein
MGVNVKFYLLMCILLISCSDPRHPPKWQNGTIVQSTLTHERGQVIKSFCSDFECQYDVNFPNGSKIYRVGLFECPLL